MEFLLEAVQSILRAARAQPRQLKTHAARFDANGPQGRIGGSIWRSNPNTDHTSKMHTLIKIGEGGKGQLVPAGWTLFVACPAARIRKWSYKLDL